MSNNSPFAYKTNSELKRAIFIFKIFRKKNLSNFLQSLLKFALKLKLPLNFIMKKTVYGHFVAGESVEKSKNVISRLGKYRVYSILDYSVEAGKDEEGFKHAVNETVKTIEHAADNEYVPFSVFKPSALTYEWVLKQEKRDDFKKEAENFRKRVFSLFKKAHELKIPILVDAEDVDYQKIIDNVVEDGMEEFNKTDAIVYQTLQMYRTDRLDYLNKLINKSVEKDFYPGIKLVRGAYLEKERKLAENRGEISPVFDTKDETDKAYNDALKLCMKNFGRVSIFNGTHNYESSELLKELMKEKQLDNNDKNIYFAQLYGMSDDLSFNLAYEGFNVAKYLPYGPIKQVMPYLMRRAEENSAVADQADSELKILRNELKKRKKS